MSIALLAQATDTATPAPADTVPPTAVLEGATSPDFWADLIAWGISILPSVLLALGLLIGAFIIAGIAGSLTRAFLTRCKTDQTVAIFLAKLARWIVLIAGLLTCLTVFGVNVTTFAAVFAAAGFAVGLALQGTLSSFAAGVMLLTFRPFKVGDVVVVDGELGKIAEIELFNTALDTLDNRRIIIPNAAVFGSKIENISYHPIRRVDVNVGAAYDAEIDATRAALEHAITTIEDVMDDPAPAVVLLELGGSSVDWTVRVWTESEKFWDVKQALIRAVKLSLDEQGISIPFPQMDVHLDGKIEKLSA